MTKLAEKTPRFGWIGLGSMGLGMARNLQSFLRQLPGATPLHYTNRTLSRGTTLEENQAVPCRTIREVVDSSDIIFISTSDDAVLESIVSDVVASEDIAGKTIVDTTTIHPQTSSKVNEVLTNHGAVYVALFGASPLAESGQLVFVLGGPNDVIEDLIPYIKGVIGRDVVRAGEDPGKALLTKTAGNFITAGLMEVLSEAHVFAEKSGLGSVALEDLIERNWGGILFAMSSRITSGAYIPPKGERPRSDLDLAIKDVSHGVTMAREVGSRLETGEVILNHYKHAKLWAAEHGDRKLDSSSMYGAIRVGAGLDFETNAIKERDS